MSTSLLKRRKIDSFVARGENQKVKSNYHFIFSSDLTDWIYASNFTGEAKKRKHKQHEKEIGHVSESIESGTPFHVKDCREV